ncbi:HD domain-containing protein [Spongorhabdus nitratireducens]
MSQSVDIIDQISDMFEQQGQATYLGENISIAEHMLQCAWLAKQAGEPDEIIAAALLHDIGHLLPRQRDNLQMLEGKDAYHQSTGADFLAPWFSRQVVTPIRLHVAAKRYLCAINSEYYSKLSSASKHTLKLQGGAMSCEEIGAFEQQDNLEAVIRVRQYDDDGKREGCSVPLFEAYSETLAKLLR